MIGNIVAAITSSGAVELGDFESLATVSVGSGGTGQIDFTSIASTYQHLQLRGIWRTNRSDGGLVDVANLRFNSDTGSNYNQHYLQGDGSAVSVGWGSGSVMSLYRPSTNSSAANIFAPFIIDILDYASTNKNKTVRILSGVDQNGTGTEMWISSGLWRNSSTAITSISITPNTGTLWVQNSHFALYGIRG